MRGWHGGWGTDHRRCRPNKAWERGLAHATHGGFYALILGLPLSGWLMVSTAKIAVPTMLYKVIPWPHIPGTTGLDVATRAWLNHTSEITHHLMVDGVYILLALHVAGALKHHFLDRDGELARMVPGPMQRMTATLGLIAVLALGFLGVGNTIKLVASAPVAAAPTNIVAPASVKLPANATVTIADPVADNAAVADDATVVVDLPTGPVKWTVVKSTSSLGFATSWSGNPVTGHFASWDANILFDPDALGASSVTVTVGMTSATTRSAVTQEALPGDDWFAAATHPKATFTAKTFRKTGKDRYEARGTLSLRGVSRPVTLSFRLTITDKTAKMSGSATLDRTAFGVGQGQWTSTDDVAGTVTVNVKLTTTRP